MDKAGHLMYASHLSSMNDAQLGSDECDLLVNLVRGREKAGLYGARMTGRGCGGTVAVLCEMGETPDRAIAEILKTYEQRTKRVAQVL
jgi:L-arabinokinase